MNFFFPHHDCVFFASFFGFVWWCCAWPSAAGFGEWAYRWWICSGTGESVSNDQLEVAFQQ